MTWEETTIVLISINFNQVSERRRLTFATKCINLSYRPTTGSGFGEGNG